jgi:hypothetical protein
MSPRLWPAAGLFGLLAPAAGFGNNHHHPAAPATCAAPTKVVVECPPPEVTFKRAAPTCVRAPGAPGCAPGVQCYPFSIPQSGPAYAPQRMMTPAPQMMMAPQMLAAPQMMMAPAPQMMMAPVAAPMMAPAMMAAPGPMMGLGAPGCGAGPAGLGGLAGLNGLSASDLEALAEHQRGLEESAARAHLADLARRYNAIAGSPAGAKLGFSPIPAAPRAPAAPKGDAPPIPPSSGRAPADGDDVLAQIQAIRREVTGLQELVREQTQILKAHQTLILRHQQMFDTPRPAPAPPAVTPGPEPRPSVPALPLPPPESVAPPPLIPPSGGR